MKKLISVFFIVLTVFSLTACGASFSKSNYREISSYVLENKDVIPHKNETEFYTHKTTGLFDACVFYGYYYTKSDEITVAGDDVYPSNLGKDVYEADGGTYFGTSQSPTNAFRRSAARQAMKSISEYHQKSPSRP